MRTSCRCSRNTQAHPLLRRLQATSSSQRVLQQRRRLSLGTVQRSHARQKLLGSSVRPVITSSGAWPPCVPGHATCRGPRAHGAWRVPSCSLASSGRYARAHHSSVPPRQHERSGPRRFPSLSRSNAPHRRRACGPRAAAARILVSIDGINRWRALRTRASSTSPSTGPRLMWAAPRPLDCTAPCATRGRRDLMEVRGLLNAILQRVAESSVYTTSIPAMGGQGRRR